MRSREEIEALMEDLKEQIEIFALEITYEKMQTDFREIYIAWYDERITLDDVLQKLMDHNLCQGISVWSK